MRRPERVAQVLARAHHLQAAIDRAEYRDRADATHQIEFTRAPVTEILDLLLLAPDIQQRALELEAADGRKPLSERALRDIVQHEVWGDQRGVWQQLRLDE